MNGGSQRASYGFFPARVPAYTVEEGVRTVGWNRNGAMRDFVPDGRCVITSAIQRIMHQVLQEKYGGPPWTYEALPNMVRDWLSVKGFHKAKILAIASENGVSLAKSIHSEMGRIGGKGNASMRREMTIQKALAGGLFHIRGVKNGGSLDLTISFMFIRIRVPSQFVSECLFEMGGQVNVDFPILEARNENRYAKDALSTDSGYLVGIRLRSRDRDGNEWSRWLKASGHKVAKKAIKVFDWWTSTGITQTDNKLGFIENASLNKGFLYKTSHIFATTNRTGKNFHQPALIAQQQQYVVLKIPKTAPKLS